MTNVIWPEAFHVLPVGDFREHETAPECWCHPTQDEERPIYIHHAMDGREAFEEGLRQPS